MRVMRYIQNVLIVLMAVVLGVPAAADQSLPASIVVIKDTETELRNTVSVRALLDARNTELKIYEIDAADRFEQSVSVNLPVDPDQARAAFERRVDRIGRDTLERQAVEAYRGVMAAVRYQVKAYPAVIFDGSSVVYGVTDLAEALGHYQRWKAEQDGSQ